MKKDTVADKKSKEEKVGRWEEISKRSGYWEKRTASNLTSISGNFNVFPWKNSRVIRKKLKSWEFLTFFIA